MPEQRQPSPERPVVRLSTRLKVAGFLALWLLEWIANGVLMVCFLFARNRVRRRMYALIQRDGQKTLSEEEGAA